MQSSRLIQTGVSWSYLIRMAKELDIFISFQLFLTKLLAQNNSLLHFNQTPITGFLVHHVRCSPVDNFFNFLDAWISLILVSTERAPIVLLFLPVLQSILWCYSFLHTILWKSRISRPTPCRFNPNTHNCFKDNTCL